ncbi:MAG: YebC/PmpR family DNA-binding transcriptional regulator [Nitrospinae bacterium]|nr:YebC/PmpR family DNA-binding transcriptional regulator [Nitrospinota bacterium]
MSGHSKWATIKHKKGALDAKRGRVWSKAIKEITVAARIGGGDINANPRMRTAILAAKAVNMPADNIERAIKKGTGELEGSSYEDASYEGYGPGGVALLVTVTTDNKNRTVSEVRSILSKHGGNMGESGCVNWMFSKKGFLSIPKNQIDENTLLDLVLNAGAEDMVVQKDYYEIITPYEEFEAVKKAVEAKKLTPTVAEQTMIPQSTVALDTDKARSMLKLMEALDDQDDVQKVYANFDVSDEVMEAIAAE